MSTRHSPSDVVALANEPDGSVVGVQDGGDIDIAGHEGRSLYCGERSSRQEREEGGEFHVSGRGR
jgi:hypothetical protein